MFKYNKHVENLKPYTIPSTTNYKHKLDIGEWLYPVHPSVLSEIAKTNDLHVYGVVDEKFDLLLKMIKEHNNLNINEDNVLITNGSDNALRLILSLFATEDSNIFVPTPTYPHFECMLDTFKVKNLKKSFVDYKISNNEYYNFLLSELKNEYDLCYLVNPSMPIGHLLSHNEIDNILDLNPNTVFVIDEAYIEFSSNKTCAKLIETHNNLIVVRTFSKFFCLASLRIGYLMTNSKFIKLLKPYYNHKDITKMSVSCAIESLKNSDYYNKNQTEYFETRDNVKEKLNKIISNNDKFIDYIMNDGMFFTIICKNPYELKEYFDKNHIAIRNKNADMKGAVRITISKKEIMEKVFQLLEKF